MSDDTQVQKPPLWMRLMPRRGFSRAFGAFARWRMPHFLLRPFLRWYSKRFGVNALEMVEPIEAYDSFLDFFTRPLPAGIRPQDPDPAAITSCADGRIQRVGTVEDGLALQVKGLTWSVADLLGSAEDARRFDGGAFHVVYLSPGDYHRYHWPWAGTATRARHLPGDLWPVNDTAVNTVPNLFGINERVAVLGNTNSGHAFAFVPVGALDVGSIRFGFLDVRTNRRHQTPETWDLDVEFERGDECGWFELGSTIVLLLEKGAGTFDDLKAGHAVQVGRRIGARSES